MFGMFVHTRERREERPFISSLCALDSPSLFSPLTTTSTTTFATPSYPERLQSMISLPFSLQDFIDGVRWVGANGGVLLLLVIALKYTFPKTGMVRVGADSFDDAGRPRRFGVTWVALEYRGVVDDGGLPPAGERLRGDGGAGEARVREGGVAGVGEQHQGGGDVQDNGEENERDEVDAQL
ncbi:hypothetical protein BC834DRAFT_974106 [Gloeopeniophorella convolvens]|nr:hypothetical protein BC834DRAFT_974106 [Gloeopeniophorella convolvens]